MCYRETLFNLTPDVCFVQLFAFGDLPLWYHTRTHTQAKFAHTCHPKLPWIVNDTVWSWREPEKKPTTVEAWVQFSVVVSSNSVMHSNERNWPCFMCGKPWKDHVVVATGCFCLQPSQAKSKVSIDKVCIQGIFFLKKRNRKKTCYGNPHEMKENSFS